MKILNIISEARKNPEQNPKISINSVISQAYNDTTDTIAGGTKNLFVSFTDIDKLGINPQTIYHTPIGIYSYPAEYIMQQIGEQGTMSMLPFAGSSPYANIFNVTGNVVNLATLSANAARRYITKIKQVWVDASDNWKEAVDQVEAFIMAAERTITFSDYPGGRLWYVSMQVAELFADKWKIERRVAWNKLFRMIGIDGCLDDGAGIIHTPEPVQCVMFAITSISNVKRVRNKYSPDIIRGRQQAGEREAKYTRLMYKKFAAMSTDEIVQFFKTNSVASLQYIKNKEARLAIAQQNPEVVQFFKNPTEQEIALAINANLSHVRFYRGRLTDNMIITALKHHPDDAKLLVLHMYNNLLSSAVQVALVQINPNIIYDLNHPTRAAFKAAIKDGSLNPKQVKDYAKKVGVTL